MCDVSPWIDCLEHNAKQGRTFAYETSPVDKVVSL